MLPSFNRETCTDAEWRAFFLAHHMTVLAHLTARVVFSRPGLFRVPCCFCGQLYLTSDTEGEPHCGDCTFNARAIARDCAKARTSVEAEMYAHHQWLIGLHTDAEPADWEYFRGQHGPGYLGAKSR
jgi:hypothetical protein